jgi:hypothetical protein
MKCTSAAWSSQDFVDTVLIAASQRPQSPPGSSPQDACDGVSDSVIGKIFTAPLARVREVVTVSELGISPSSEKKAEVSAIVLRCPRSFVRPSIDASKSFRIRSSRSSVTGWRTLQLPTNCKLPQTVTISQPSDRSTGPPFHPGLPSLVISTNSDGEILPCDMENRDRPGDFVRGETTGPVPQ